MHWALGFLLGKKQWLWHSPFSCEEKDSGPEKAIRLSQTAFRKSSLWSPSWRKRLCKRSDQNEEQTYYSGFDKRCSHPCHFFFQEEQTFRSLSIRIPEPQAQDLYCRYISWDWAPQSCILTGFLLWSPFEAKKHFHNEEWKHTN